MDIEWPPTDLSFLDKDIELWPTPIPEEGKSIYPLSFDNVENNYDIHSTLLPLEEFLQEHTTKVVPDKVQREYNHHNILNTNRKKAFLKTKLSSEKENVHTKSRETSKRKANRWTCQEEVILISFLRNNEDIQFSENDVKKLKRILPRKNISCIQEKYGNLATIKQKLVLGIGKQKI